MRRAALTIIMVGLLYALAEIVAGVGLWALATRGLTYDPISTDLGEHEIERVERALDSTGGIAFSPALGWTVGPGGVADHRVNQQGIRATRTFATAPPSDTVRVSAFGDSFTFGAGVDTDAAWATQMDRLLPDVEVLNFGVPAYGVDQAYLRYQLEGKVFRSDVVLIGFIPENINRHVNRFRPFYSPNGQPLTKPRFVLRESELTLLPNPLDSRDAYRRMVADPERELPRLGQDDFFYLSRRARSAWDWSPLVRLGKLSVSVAYRRRNAPDLNGQYNTHSEAFAVTSALFARFVSEVRADGAEPMIVIFPMGGDLRRYAAGEPRVYDPLLRDFASRGLPYIDVLEAFPDCATGCPIDSLVPLHYSERGNEVVARYLATELPRQLAWDQIHDRAGSR